MDAIEDLSLRGQNLVAVACFNSRHISVCDFPSEHWTGNLHVSLAILISISLEISFDPSVFFGELLINLYWKLSLTNMVWFRRSCARSLRVIYISKYTLIIGSTKMNDPMWIAVDDLPNRIFVSTCAFTYLSLSGTLVKSWNLSGAPGHLIGYILYAVYQANWSLSSVSVWLHQIFRLIHILLTTNTALCGKSMVPSSPTSRHNNLSNAPWPQNSVKL